MKKVLLFLGVCLTIILLNPVYAKVFWWDFSWSYRQPIYISNTAGNLTNYQVRIDLNSSNVGSNFDWSNNGNDIRFTNSTNDLLYFWIEYWNATEEKAIIWVNVTYLPNNTNTTIYMYYGNPVADSISDINSTFISVINNLSLKASWHFDENAGNIVYDTSGNNNDGTIYGANWTTGKYGSGLEFDGTNDYISVPDDSSLDITDEITIEAWFNCHNATTNYWARTIIRKQFNYVIAVKDSGNGPYVKFYLWGEEYNSGSLISGFFSLNEWVHIVATYNKSKMKVYLNGELSKTKDYDDTLRVSSYNVEIAYHRGDSYWFDGLIDEVRIYNRALNSSEISTLYNNYGYTTENYSGSVLVKKYADPQPSVSNIGEEEQPSLAKIKRSFLYPIRSFVYC